MNDQEMSTSDYYEAMKIDSQKRKTRNLESGIRRLEEKGVSFEMLSLNHIRVGVYDYWPSTGLFIERATKRRGRGIQNLLRRLGF